jgi:hypothetical protein
MIRKIFGWPWAVIKLKRKDKKIVRLKKDNFMREDLKLHQIMLKFAVFRIISKYNKIEVIRQ